MKRPKRLAILLPSLGGGGAERSMYQLANGLADSGISVDLVLSTNNNQYLDKVNSSVGLHCLGASRQLTSLFALLGYIRKYKPDIVLSALITMNVISVLLRGLSSHKFKLYLSERAVSSVSLKDKGLFQRVLFSFLIKKLYPLSDGIVAVSLGVANDIIENFNIPRPHISTIYNPVVGKNIYEAAKEPLNIEFLSGVSKIIISIGRFVPQKNFRLLIDAFALIPRGTDAKLVILGDGPLRTTIQGLVIAYGLGDRVLLPGFVENPFPWLRRASLYVCSSNYEGLPGSLIQAMAFGLPIVSTDCPGGPGEVLEGGRFGRLVPIGNPRALSYGILEKIDSGFDHNVRLRAKDFEVSTSVAEYIRVLGL